MAMPNRHQLDLSDPVLREQFGLRVNCPETILVQTHFRRLRRQYRSRAEMVTLVHEVLMAASAPMSRREIANSLGISKNWYLLEAIAELVALGRIVEHESAWRGIPMFVYEVAS